MRMLDYPRYRKFNAKTVDLLQALMVGAGGEVGFFRDSVRRTPCYPCGTQEDIATRMLSDLTGNSCLAWEIVSRTHIISASNRFPKGGMSMKKSKLVWRIVVCVIVFLVAAVAGAWVMIDSLAKRAVQQGGEY